MENISLKPLISRLQQEYNCPHILRCIYKDITLAGFRDKSISRSIRLLAASCVLAPALAWGQSAMDASIAEIRDQVRYVPDKALVLSLIHI